MNIVNIHERALPASGERVGALIDGLASREDRLWPRKTWPRMEFDRPLGVGADGGHGPVRYVVEAYAPGESIRFRFTGPTGFEGYHALERIPVRDGVTLLRHTLKMSTHGPALLTWPLAGRPLHDALVEDALDCAEAALGKVPAPQPWSAWVRVLRWLVSRGKARPQIAPAVAAR